MLSGLLPSSEGKPPAAGIDHPGAVPTPSREARPFSVFFSWGAGELQLEPDGKQMWQGKEERESGGFSGDGCRTGQSSVGGVGGGTGGRRSKGAPLHHGGLGGGDSKSSSQGTPPPASPPVISLREKGQVRSTWSPGEGPCESRVQLKGKCALNSTQGRRGFWTGISDLLRNWQEIRNQDTMSPLNCHPWPQTLDMFLQYQAYPMGHQACPGTARPRSPPLTPLACGPGDPCPLDCLGQF